MGSRCGPPLVRGPQFENRCCRLIEGSTCEIDRVRIIATSTPSLAAGQVCRYLLGSARHELHFCCTFNHSFDSTEHRKLSEALHCVVCLVSTCSSYVLLIGFDATTQHRVTDRHVTTAHRLLHMRSICVVR